MHHITLDRTRTNNRNLDNKIIKYTRLDARKHIHLRSAFHLKYPQRIAFAKHVIDRLIVARQIGERQFFTIIYLWIMPVNKIERLANASKHTQRKHIDF